MKITIEKEVEVEVELPNGFYWDKPSKHAYWVTDNEILETFVGNNCLSVEVVLDGWIKECAGMIWREVYQNPVQYKNEKIRQIVEKTAEFYGLA